ncbi:GGDEF domain-containing protein [uncultured Jatrophihabitans sp.]|uniref:GGDEF domain-containing protein n=1 Tax=uncultured Jatrophihabitans sp. TaxID=1610747 RepID=UPI0035CBBAC9
MAVIDNFQPRHESVAKWTLLVLTVVAAGVTAGFALALPTATMRAQTGTTVAACLAIVVLAGCLFAARTPPRAAWAAYPFAAVALIAMLDISTADASVTGQIFFFLPVLYAAAQLRRAAAAMVCAAAVLAELVVTLTLLPLHVAVADAGFVAAMLCSTAALLVHNAERNDALIEQLRIQAAIDPLTGLHTRRVLDHAAENAFAEVDHAGGTALLLIDLDRFKQVNDVHGHPAGDRVLQELAGILRAAGRRTDIVSRMGGDEFAVLLAACTVPAAFDRASQILRAVREHVFDVGPWTAQPNPDAPAQLRLSVSIGLAHLPTHAQDLLSLYRVADMSLYEAKRNGRDQLGGRPTPERVTG